MKIFSLLIIPDITAKSKSGDENIFIFQVSGEFFPRSGEKVGKKGVVRDPYVHGEVIQKVMDFADLMGFLILGLTWSPVKGPEGNIEYLIHLRREEPEGKTVPAGQNHPVVKS